MRVRVNVSLPEETLRLLDRAAGKGARSELINEAVVRYLANLGRNRLRWRLKEGAVARAERDRALATECLSGEDETWRRGR